MKKIILMIGISIFLFSCSSTIDEKYNKETVKEDMITMKNSMDSTNFKLLIGSMLRLTFQNKSLENMTYSEILDDGKKWKVEQEKIEVEQKALSEKALREEQVRMKKLTESVLVSCFEKGYLKIDYQDYITYKFIIKNKSDKKIRAIKGGIIFTNLFDEEIKSLSFVYDQPIDAGIEATYNAQTNYNQFVDSDKSLRIKDLKDLKVVWKPEKIIFEDGTILK